ncbi:class I SAM-dependent methyltransferase [Sorangium sp. So ce406]|uniref:class I SAM-dependent methyltransferase n=1 Tax=Sorangium sp. So ce406 TaxID=3133311 RepID=UPI003F5C63BE
MSTLYDRIGTCYSATRRTDPRIAALIRGALGDARSVINVGAGAGAYEPTDREVLAVEPSETMIGQRPLGSAPALQARAEDLPLPDRSYDAALAVNTLHHWTDLRAGLRELRRVARKRIVIFMRDPPSGRPFWLTENYLPSLDPSRKYSAVIEAIREELPSVKALPFELPRDCADGLFVAYWGRPEMYLDGEVRRNISNFALAEEGDIAEGLARLRADLASGAWDRKHGELRRRESLDLGHRVLVAELG